MAFGCGLALWQTLPRHKLTSVSELSFAAGMVLSPNTAPRRQHTSVQRPLPLAAGQAQGGRVWSPEEPTASDHEETAARRRRTITEVQRLKAEPGRK